MSRRPRPSPCGIVTLVLICVGLYGLMAFIVGRRTAEIAVRVALGAKPSDIRTLIARQAISVLLIGVPAAWIAGRLASAQLSPLLVGLTPADSVSFGVATMLLALVPPRRRRGSSPSAARIDPIMALRHQ